ncbi:MAG: hypothetical protein C0172_02845 [Caldisphaera sp.]|nr:MAG: hypothetical protein C0172_02845 [Caldisphaera sp.]
MEIEKAFEEYKKIKIQEGYPEHLVDRSILFAKHYLDTITGFLDGRHPNLVERAKKEMLPEALSFAERWIAGIYGLAGKKAEVHPETFWEEKIKTIVG